MYSQLAVAADIGVARILAWGSPSRESHAMTSSEIFKTKDFLRDKDTLEWKIRVWCLGWCVNRILIKGEDFETKVKMCVSKK